MTVGVTMKTAAGSRRRRLSSASKTSSSSLARSRRTLVSTATSGLFLALSAINQFHAALEQALAFFVGKMIGDSARLLGRTSAEGNRFCGCLAFLHAGSFHAN